MKINQVLTTTQYNAIKLQQSKLYQICNQADTKLRAYCRPHQDAMGLVADHIKQGDEYKQLKAASSAAFQAIRSFNSKYVKLIHQYERKHNINRFNRKEVNI